MLLPAAAIPIRAMLVGELARSVRRSAAVRKALTQPALSSWLAIVDEVAPGLVDPERVRLARILSRNAGPTTKGA